MKNASAAASNNNDMTRSAGSSSLYLQDLISCLEQCRSKADISFVSDAYLFAEAAHRGQTRKSGEPYIIHPVEVAKILAELEVDQETLAAALLHDVVEDTGIALEIIHERFGAEVALLVDGVTKLSRIEYKSKEEQQAENLRKMILAMAKDIRVILIKLADRLHNMRTLKHHHKQKEIAKETLEIYAPLASRLGIYRMKWELEDRSFSFLEPERHNSLKERIKKSRPIMEEYIATVGEDLRQKLAAVGVEAEISGRPKHLYSINAKMIKQEKDLDEIFDMMAVRCMVASVRDCYAALGVVHTHWRPIPGRFKDFIAMPKSNMYQSLHTTVVGPNGEPLEIQIRTREMHRTAEFGIAAHWRYKEGVRGEQDVDKKLAWLRQILEWEHDLRDPREFMEGLKIDIFADTVFVFSPTGDVFELPAGSMPLDFAYRIHTAVGHRCIGAKINGHIVPLDYKLKNGDIVEVMTTKTSSPKMNWLNLTKTSQAKTKIRQWFKKGRRDESIVKGKDILERELKKQGLELDHDKSEILLEMVKKFNFLTLDDIYVAICDGVLNAGNLVNKLKLKEEEAKPEIFSSLEAEAQAIAADTKPTAGWGKTTKGIRMKGVDNLLVRLSHCCNPVPGDEILGYITRGRGVSIHRANCRNILYAIRNEQERLVEVAWDKDFVEPFQVKLVITAADRAGLLNDVMAVLKEMKISANWVTARSKKDSAVIDLVLETKGLDQLEFIMNKMGRIKDIQEIRRVSFGDKSDKNGDGGSGQNHKAQSTNHK